MFENNVSLAPFYEITIRRPAAIGSITVMPGNGAIDIPSLTNVTLTLTYNDAKAANGAAVQRRAGLTLVP